MLNKKRIISDILIAETLAALSFGGFTLFLINSRYKKYFGAFGWICLLAMVFSNFPEYLHYNNFAYPIIAVIALPFLYTTVKLLLQENNIVHLATRGASVAFLIYAPFAYIEPLENFLISVNIYSIQIILDAIGFSYTFSEWNMFMHDIFRVEIVLGCTGIKAIALMTGILAAVPSKTKEKILSAVVIIATVFIMNLIRNVFVILAYTQQWFPYFPEIASNGQYGYESFFWSHNIISEFGLSLLTIIFLAIVLIKINPQLKDIIRDLIYIYRKELGIKVKSDEKSS
ncbi:archaeosortase A [Methanomicrobium antiquum]|uniref:Archaeosortase A n=1 Tax=Methanomicrobium antiquum TaxID=487686 RepID=A0AAF0FNF2_9EURY|nr:archaeosortase A [Methanomicrobium antiquum]WFN36682.1 archaeosortase A [Methanomicrobium antiquum]